VEKLRGLGALKKTPGSQSYRTRVFSSQDPGPTTTKPGCYDNETRVLPEKGPGRPIIVLPESYLLLTCVLLETELTCTHP